MEPSSRDMKQIDIIKIYGRKKCLVIDDFPEIRGSLTRILRNFGAESVDTAASGSEAVRLCNNNKYDVVMCDYNLGGGQDGQQVLEEVRFLRVLLMTSLFVMLTGESSREMVLGALECQPDDYITKPYTEASLRTRLNRAIVRHEALLPIKTNISAGDYKGALTKCNEMIKAGSRYAPECVKMKGQLLFLLRQLKEAQSLYESVLDKKPLIWAKLGMGKTMLEMGELDAAEDILEEVIREDSRYIEAHDLLSEVFEKKEDMLSSQKSIEKASQVSPKSVHRHRKLAEITDLNGDDELSMKSHQNAIKWGMNSCYESVQDSFNYARKASDVIRSKHSYNDNNAIAKQAATYLERAKKRHGKSPEVEAQAHMVEAQLFDSQGKKTEAIASADKAKALFSSLRSPSTEVSVEFARTLHTMDEEDQARAILTSVAANNVNNEKLLRIIDGITSEPISDNGKSAASSLTKSGIDSYEQNDYIEAIAVFSKAINSYPKHIGLNLNLIQAVIATTEATGATPAYEKMCRRSLRAVGDIKVDHKQFKRFAFLQKQLSKYYPDVLGSV